MKKISLVLGSCLVLALGSARADESYRHGDWTVDDAKAFVEAYTINADGKSVGYWCSKDEDSCFFYLRTNGKCEDGARLRVQGDTEIGKQPVELLCHHIRHEDNHQYLYFFTDGEGARRLLAERLYLGLRLPGAGAMRFSLRGSKRALQRVEELRK